MLNEKSFNATLKAITKNADQLAAQIHDAGMFALLQANQHGNTGFAQRLIEAMGKKHDAMRVARWLVHYGCMTITKGEVKYRKRKDITSPEHFDANIEAAEQSPYWVLTPQGDVTVKIDVIARLEGIVRSISNAHKKQAEGKEVQITHEDALAEVQALIAKLKAQPAPATEIITL